MRAVLLAILSLILVSFVAIPSSAGGSACTEVNAGTSSVLVCDDGNESGAPDEVQVTAPGTLYVDVYEYESCWWGPCTRQTIVEAAAYAGPASAFSYYTCDGWVSDEDFTCNTGYTEAEYEGTFIGADAWNLGEDGGSLCVYVFSYDHDVFEYECV